MSDISQAFTDLASMNELSETILNTMADLLKSISNFGQSLHGERTVSKAILAGQPANITKFDCGNNNTKIAENQQELYQQFKLELQKAGIAYIDVEVGKDGTKGIIFQDKDREKVQEITDRLNIRHERTQNYEQTRAV